MKEGGGCSRAFENLRKIFIKPHAETVRNCRVCAVVRFSDDETSRERESVLLLRLFCFVLFCLRVFDINLLGSSMCGIGKYVRRHTPTRVCSLFLDSAVKRMAHEVRGGKLNLEQVLRARFCPGERETPGFSAASLLVSLLVCLPFCLFFPPGVLGAFCV